MCGRQSKVGRISSSPLSFRRRLIILFLFSSQFPFFLLLILSIYLFIYFWGFGFKRFFIMGAGSLSPLGIFHISFGRVSKFAPPPPHPQMRNWEIFRLRRVSWKMWLDFRVELEFLMAHFDVITMRTRFKRGRKQTIEKSICNLQKGGNQLQNAQQRNFIDAGHTWCSAQFRPVIQVNQLDWIFSQSNEQSLAWNLALNLAHNTTQSSSCAFHSNCKRF